MTFVKKLFDLFFYVHTSSYHLEEETTDDILIENIISLFKKNCEDTLKEVLQDVKSVKNNCNISQGQNNDNSYYILVKIVIEMIKDVKEVEIDVP